MLLSINKKTGQECYLVPELCRMTGVSSELMDDFRAMREIKSLTHSDAPAKAKECLKLFDAIAQSQKCKEIMEEMEIEFVKEPIRLKAYKLEAGKMIMGINEATNKRIAHDIESCGRDLDKMVQCKLYEQPPIQKWGIFYQERDAPSAKEFLINMEKTIQQFGYQAK